MADLSKSRAVAELKRRLKSQTQQELAEELGWDRGLLSYILRGRRGVGHAYIASARDAGIPSEWWFEQAPDDAEGGDDAA